MKISKLIYGLPIFGAFLSLTMHWPIFSLDLQSNHVWRQTQTQTVINNFYEEDFCILNPRINSRGDTDGIQRMEFPLMQWTYAAAYKLFGPSIKLSRILSFCIGLLSAIGVYFLSAGFFKNKQIGLISFYCLLFAPSFYYYTVCPMPDNLALCFGIWGLYFSTRWIRTTSPLALILTVILLALSALVKLPFLLFYAVPGIHALVQFRKRLDWNSTKPIWVMSTSAIPVAAWYIWVIP